MRRAILDSHDIELIRLFSDVPEFRQRLHREVADETYPKLHELLRPLSDNDIDRAIQAWNGKIESKHAVVRYMKDHAREKDTAAWLAHEFDGGEGKTPLAIRPESPNGMALPWPKVQRRIAQLIKEERFYTQVEKDNLDDVDPIAIRETLAQRGIVDGQVVDPEKLDRDPFVQRVMADARRIAAEETSEQPTPPDLSGQPITRAGDTITIGNGDTVHEIDITVSDEEYEAIRQTIPDEKADDPSAPIYHVGDTVYLENQEYRITELREDFDIASKINLSCILTGFTLTDEETSNQDRYIAEFTSDSGGWYTVRVVDIGSEQEVGIDNELTRYYELEFDGNHAIWGIREDNSNLLVWEADGLSFTIYGTPNISELIKVAEGITVDSTLK